MSPATEPPEPPATEPPIRRILVALDGSAASLAALDAAAGLAEALEAELRGVFVEEADLLLLPEMATLVREVDALSARIRSLEAGRLRREIRIVARRARRAFERRVATLEVQWTFERTRGAVPAELRRVAASEADLVVLGLRGHTPGRGPGSTVLDLLREPVAPVMVLPRGARLSGEVYAAVGDPEAGRDALAVAAAVARRSGLPVTVLLPADGEGEELERKVERAMGGVARARIRTLPLRSATALASRLRREPCGLLVLSPDFLERADGEALPLLLEHLGCPVLVTA